MAGSEDVRPQSGSCVRCGRALDLASVKVDGRWYGNEACAREGPCPLEARRSGVPEPWLYARPQRFFRRRQPKELQVAPRPAPSGYQPASESK